MAEFETKYFGKINVIEDGENGSANVKYNDQEIRIFFYKYNSYGDKIKTCLEIIDKYVEINKIAKNEIMENYIENKTVNFYFECHFDILEEEKLVEIFGVNNFNEIEIKNVVGKLKYPNLLFNKEENEINVSVDYMVSKKYSSQILCVKMDKEINITGFSHES